MSKEKITQADRLIRNAEANFAATRVTEAEKQFSEALALIKDIPDTQPTQDFINRQLSLCRDPKSKEAEQAMLQKKKLLDKEFGGNDMGFGGMLMSGLLNSFLPKIQKAIEDNKPKMIAFFRGQLDITFQPIPPDTKPQPRIIIAELVEHPSGDPSKADVIIQVRKAHLTQINVAEDDKGTDVGLEKHFSAVEFANMIISGNIEEMMKA